MNRTPLRILIDAKILVMSGMTWAVCYASVLSTEFSGGFVIKVVNGIPLRDIVFVVGIYGMIALASFKRAYLTNPLLDKRYGQSLAATPWEVGKPLPLGPVGLGILDLPIFLAAALLCCCLISRKQDLGPALAGLVATMLIPHILATAISLGSRKVPRRLFLMAVPLTAYPFFNLYVAIGVLLLIYVMVMIALRSALARWPWEGVPETDAQRIERIYQSAKAQLDPATVAVGPRPDPQPARGLGDKVIIAALVAWWIHVALAILVHFKPTTDPPNPIVIGWAVIAALVGSPMTYVGAWAFYVFFLTLAALFWLLAHINGTRSPTSMAGRFASGRIVIPSYDRVFLAPLALLACGILAPIALHRLGWPDMLLPAATIFASIFLALALSPNIEDFRLTACMRYNIRLLQMAGRRAKPNPNTIQIKFKV